MIRVAHIITRLDWGGSAQNTLLTCRFLADRYDTLLLHGPTLESHMGAVERRWLDAEMGAARSAGVRIEQVPGLVRRVSPLNDLRAAVLLWNRLRRERPHLVHTHTSKAGLLGRWAAVLAGVPVVIHTPHGHVFYGHFRAALTKVFLWMERITDRVTDRTVALTEGERMDYVRLRVSMPKKLTTIHSGVDVKRFVEASVDVGRLRLELGIAAEALVVGTVGWLNPVKGPMELLLAMERVWTVHSEAVLVFVGQGTLEAELKERVRSGKNHGRVRFLGWRADVPELMKVMDVFVLPSRNEGMGRAAVEAMAGGRPVVASRVGGVPDLVQDGWNGFLVEAGDAEGMAEAVRRLLESAELREEMGRRGRERSWDYSVERMVERLDGLYRDCLSEEGLGARAGHAAG